MRSSPTSNEQQQQRRRQTIDPYDTIDPYMVDFLHPDKYLKHGNERQRRAWEDLESLQIFGVLERFQPVLAGTIPLGIDVEGVSDLDIICCVMSGDLDEFATIIARHYSHCRGFCLERGDDDDDEPYVVAQFQAKYFVVEIFGQQKPVFQQNAYRHMIIEHRLLQEKGDEFRRAIILLKQSGVKTEPAFAQVLGLQGDPYQALLKL